MADTRIPIFNADAQTAYIDYRSEATNGDGRQVIVIGDPSINANVATVATQDLGGSDQTTPGIVMRLAGSAAVQLVGSSGTIAVHLQSTGGTLGVRVGQIDGTTSVYLAQTAGTIGVRVGLIEGTTAVFLQGTGGTLGVDVGKINDNVSVKFASVSGTAGVNIGKIDGTVQTTVGRIDDVVSVRMNSVPGTVGVNLGKVDGTIQVNVGKISDTIAVFLTGTAGSLIVKLAPGTGIGNITNTVAVYFDRGNPSVNVTGGSGTLGVYIDSTAGTIKISVDGAKSSTLTVKIDPAGAAFINAGHTASIFTVSGSTSGVSASGVNLVAPSSSYNFKIFAYSIQTTVAASVVPRFVNGSGASQTEFWRPLITPVSTSGAAYGANLAVTPPGFLFATGTNTSLNLHLDTAALVHYSVSYIKESA